MFASRPADDSGALLNERYRLCRLLGEGAASRVYSAQDTWLDRVVAVKVLRRVPECSHSPMDAQIAKEARALARLSHPNVVTIHDVGLTGDGVAFLVMALAPDGTLEQELERRGTLPPDELLPAMLPVIGALACTHRHGIIHRDLKPGNLALERTASGQLSVKVLDFGIAKVRAYESNAHQILGTPAYMAPEQVRGEALGPHTDVWALGVILFRALSGRLPYEADGTAALLYRIANERAAQLSTLCPQLSGHIALAVDRALEPELRLRYESMEAFARALAIAGRQAGLSLPADPEPFGLPHFGEWLVEADVSTTTPLAAPLAPPTPPTTEPPPTAEAVSAPTHRQTPVRNVLLWAIPIGLALLALLAWSAPLQPEATETTKTPPASTMSSGATVPSELRSDLPSATPRAVEVLDAPPPVTNQRDASIAQDPMTQGADVASKPPPKERPRPRQPRRRDQPTEPSAEPPNTPKQIVKQWDW